MSLVCELFAAVRGRVFADPVLQEILDKRVYFNLPEKPIYPCIVFGIDEIVDHQDTCRIAFNLQLLSSPQKGAEPLKIAHAIDAALEGTLPIDQTTQANCRKTSMTIDLPIGPQPKAIKQFYQTMIWRNQHD